MSLTEISEVIFASDMTFAEESSVSDIMGSSGADASGTIVCAEVSSEDIPITY